MSHIRTFAALAVIAITLPGLAAAQEAKERPEGTMSRAERAATGQAAIESAHGAQADVERLLGQAQETGDVIKVNCVTDKLASLRKQVARADAAAPALESDDLEARGNAYFEATGAGERALQLRAEAQQCVGELAVAIDEDMVVDTDGPEDLAGDDVVLPSLPPVTVRPPAASPSE